MYLHRRIFIITFIFFYLICCLSRDASAQITPIQYPSDILNLQNWKLTLPINNAQEIKQPALSTYSSEYFYLNQNNDGVVFYSPAGGATTANSAYARSELREMKSTPFSVTDDCVNKDDKACWSSSSGYHSMSIDQAITVIPTVKPHVVIGQIHDGSDDIVVFRLEGKKLFINADGTADDFILTANYELGTRFTAKFEVQNDLTKYYYNGQAVKNSQGIPVVLNGAYKNAYFKAGMYVQSNEGNNQYGKNEIYDIDICHASSETTASTECASLNEGVSLTPTNTPEITQTCQSDINQSGMVDLSDYSLLVRNFLVSNPELRADINSDGIVDLRDYSILVKNFLKSCTN